MAGPLGPSLGRADAGGRAAKAAAIACATLTLGMLAWLLRFASHGLDFSDEGYYIAWISNPGLYDASASQFGFVYHPLFLLLDGNLAGLRRANVLITLALAWWMFAALLARGDAPASAGTPRVLVHVACAGLAVSALLVFRSWLLTPNYNGLTLQALLLTGAGLAYAASDRDRVRRTGWIVVGLGGALAFLAKPTSALLLALLALVAMLGARRDALRSVVVAAVVAAVAVLAAAIAIDGSPVAFVQRLVDIGHVMDLLADYGLGQALRWDPFHLTVDEKTIIYSGGVAIAATATLARQANALLAGAAQAVTIAACAWAALLLAGEAPLPAPTHFVALLSFGVALGAVLATGAALGPFGARNATREHWFAALAIAAFPAAYAFGTTNDYWSVAQNAGVFWIAAGTMALRNRLGIRTFARAALPIAASAQVLTAALFAHGAARPYRQLDAVQRQDTPAVFGSGIVRVSPAAAGYLDALRERSKAAGLAPGTPVLDMTGQSPTALHAIGALPVGQPWWIGGYPGSDAFARWLISRLPCDQLADAWLLTEPGGPRAFSATVPLEYGADPARDFRIVAVFRTHPGAGEYPERTQYLLRPTRDREHALAACTSTRR